MFQGPEVARVRGDFQLKFGEFDGVLKAVAVEADVCICHSDYFKPIGKNVLISASAKKAKDSTA